MRSLHHAVELAERAGHDGSRRFAPGVQAWLSSPRQGLHAEVEAASGRDAVAGALARLAPSRITIDDWVASGRVCWAELHRRVEDEAETCVAGLFHDERGQVTQLIWLRAAHVPVLGRSDQEGPRAHEEGGEIAERRPPPAGRPIFERYFTELQRSSFRAAAAHFSLDTIYSHPPYVAGADRVLFVSRQELWRGFESERGPTPARQVITGFWQRNDRVFLTGVIEGIEDGGSFVSTGQITPEGEIGRYVAFYSSRRLPIPEVSTGQG